MWVGHFDLWVREGIIMYRHALVLAGGVEASGQQCEALLGTALDTCERYFTAFQFVIWAGKAARESDRGKAFFHAVTMPQRTTVISCSTRSENHRCTDFTASLVVELLRTREDP